MHQAQLDYIRMLFSKKKMIPIAIAIPTPICDDLGIGIAIAIGIEKSVCRTPGFV
jgi:hypothetical protein